MILSTGQIILYILIFIGFDLFNYFDIRTIIWSIVCCDKNRKPKNIKHLGNGMGLPTRITMGYLKEHTRAYRRNFLFWMRVKAIFVVTSIAILVGYIICAIIISPSYLTEKISLCVLIQKFIVFLILRFQFGWRFSEIFTTKYDRIRLNKNK